MGNSVNSLGNPAMVAMGLMAAPAMDDYVSPAKEERANAQPNENTINGIPVDKAPVQAELDPEQKRYFEALQRLAVLSARGYNHVVSVS